MGLTKKGDTMPYELYEFNNHRKRRKKKPAFKPNHEDCEKAINDFLKKGGSIEKKTYIPDHYEIVGRFQSTSQPNLMDLI